ncbi:MAG TPA: hypothetical protein VJL31_13110 [Gemmatimonadales bacterium]|nr:hypothetical protein [Gemmatimonadales bacterium]
MMDPNDDQLFVVSVALRVQPPGLSILYLVDQEGRLWAGIGDDWRLVHRPTWGDLAREEKRIHEETGGEGK